jgi:transposase-like protein
VAASLAARSSVISCCANTSLCAIPWYRVCARAEHVRVPSTSAINTKYSTRHISTTMSPILDAIAAINALKPGEKIQYAKVARKYGVDRMTLTRRHQGTQGTITEKNINQQRLTPQQEEELVTYIIGLTERHLEPTREIIANFALKIGKIKVLET